MFIIFYQGVIEMRDYKEFPTSLMKSQHYLNLLAALNFGLIDKKRFDEELNRSKEDE